ncbi:MAG: DUF1178 family protein [Pseudomonadota bacterium]
MIRYALECACGDQFEAWFKNAASCDAQLESGAVSCPTCGGVDVGKALMAPSVAKKEDHLRATPRSAPREDAAAAPEQDRGKASAPDARFAAHPARALEQKLRALRAHVEANAEHVGANFAKEARAIHEGDAEARPIYGEAKPEEAEALLEDGVAVAPIPWIDRRDD